jgi:uncharacterized protein YndB with AHSA1/START domain
MMTTTTVPDRIEKQVLLRAPVARVWRAITDSQQFGSWFGVRFPGPFKGGECTIGTIAPTTVDPAVAAMQKPYEGMTFDITIERIEPEKLFSFRWHPFAIDPKIDYSKEPATLVEFALKEVPGGVMLTVTESGFEGIPLSRRADAFKANEGGWAHQMTLIEKYLAKAS